jgi:hypothetical protein
MSIFQPTAVTCPQCDTRQFVDLVDTINVDRFPYLRDKVLDRTLHRLQCAKCQAVSLVEKKLFYMDRGRNTFLLVGTPRSRPDYRKGPKELGRILDQVRGRRRGAAYTRTVFGLEELREKLVAQDAALDDRVAEVMKGYIMDEHPVLMKRPRLRLVLESVNSEQVAYTAQYDHNTERFDIRMPRTILERVLSNTSTVEKVFAEKHKDESIFAPQPAAWINFRRWSTGPDALSLLRTFAEQVRLGQPINAGSADFTRMLRDLPRGSQLPTSAKRDLRDLRDAFQRQTPPNEAALDKLFEIRFDKNLEDEWATNRSNDDINRIWNVLEALPAMNVEGNIKLRSILVNVGDGGGLYQWSGDIELGDRDIETSPESFDSTVRHEVGHAVMAQSDAAISRWLTERFGWEFFDPKNDKRLDVWITMLWANWPNEAKRVQQEIRDAVRSSLGRGGQWGPPPPPQLPTDHLWNRADFAPRLALAKSTTNWFDSNRDWQRAGNRAFFANYWYAWPMTVGTAALDMVNGFMPSTYAAMSHYEFFAELYALYFDPGDPRRARIPADVMKWLENQVGKPPAASPAPPAPRAAPKRKTAARKKAAARKAPARRR